MLQLASGISFFYERAALRDPLVSGSLWQGLRRAHEEGEDGQVDGTFAKKEEIKTIETWEHR